MKALVAVVLFCSCALGASADGASETIDPLEEVMKLNLGSITICGRSTGGHSKGLVDEQVMETDCDAGGGHFVMSLRSWTVHGVETLLKRAISDSRPVERTRIKCRAMVTVEPVAGEALRLFVMSNGEIRSRDRAVMPLNAAWMDQLIVHIGRLMQ